MSVVAVVVDEVVVAVEVVTSTSSDLKRTVTEFQTMIWMNKEFSVRHENVINQFKYFTNETRDERKHYQRYPSSLSAANLRTCLHTRCEYDLT